MQVVINQLDLLLKVAFESISRMEEEELSEKSSPERWSKKEMLGHLVDSATYNLQRFNEAQFHTQPYIVRPYNQDEMVKANHYQTANSLDILGCFLALNHRIRYVVQQLSNDVLSYAVELPDGKVSDLRFLIMDYVTHLAHHVSQIKRA
jgi:hypothetical protein